MNAPDQITQWLVTRNWPALTSHFARVEPNSAGEYQARALMTLHCGVAPIDWPAVTADMRRACELSPHDVLLACNLLQALVDSGKAIEAYETAVRLNKLHPTTYVIIEKLALAAAAVHKWSEALNVLLRAKQLLGPAQPLPEPAVRLLAELSSRWWEPIIFGGITLRRPDSADADFLRATFRDEAFMLHYHRFQLSNDEAVKKFIVTAQASPRQSRRVDWIIVNRTGKRIGLAAIVDIDFGNERGELLIGLPGKRDHMAALKASVAVLDFAYKRLSLAKMMSYVYGDNLEAQSNTRHLGFEQEGLLRNHLTSASGRVDLFVNGMSRADYESPLLKKLIFRWSQLTAGVD